MRLSYTKRQRAEMIEVLEQEFQDADEAATAVLAKAMDLFAERAKLTVVGQIKPRPVDGEGVDLDTVAVGYYPTPGQANEAALKLAYSTSTHEEHRVMVLPLFHGSPADYYSSRSKARKEAAITDSSLREREQMRRVQWFKDNPGATPPADWGFVPFDNEFEDCWACEGHGKVRKEQAA